MCVCVLVCALCACVCVFHAGGNFQRFKFLKLKLSEIPNVRPSDLNFEKLNPSKFSDYSASICVICISIVCCVCMFVLLYMCMCAYIQMCVCIVHVYLLPIHVRIIKSS